MPRIDPKCPHCGVEMEKGAILDRGHGNHKHASQWIEGGDEEKHRFLGIEWTNLKTSGRSTHTIESYRCPKCGLLANYAP